MRRLLTASVLFTLVLFATASSQEPAHYWERTVVGSDYPFPFRFVRAQQPLNPPAKVADDKKADKKTDKKPDPTDAAVAAALANDADVKMAKAKIQLAEAELTKARQAVTLKVVTLKAKIDQLKAEVRAAEDRLTLTTRMFERGAIQQSELLTARDRLEAARTALALAETEWKLLTGSAFGSPVADLMVPDHTASALAWLAAQQSDPSAARLAKFMAIMEAAREREAVKGPIPERIRAALDKPVKLGAKGEKITFEKALEVFNKEAGFDVPVRSIFRVNSIVTEGEELSVGAWFQLFADTNLDLRFLVREHGLLVTLKDQVPPDAPSLTEFWKQKPLAKATTETKVEPAPKK